MDPYQRIAELEAELAAKDARIAEQDERIAALERQVAMLEQTRLFGPQHAPEVRVTIPFERPRRIEPAGLEAGSPARPAAAGW